MLRPLLGIAVSLLAVAPAAAQTSPEDAALAALDGCYAIRRGGAAASIAAAQGFAASTREADRWIKSVGDAQVQIKLTHSPAGDGQTVHLCTVGIWGRISSPMTLKIKVMGRATREGYPIGQEKPRPAGGTVRVMSRETATTLEGLTLIMNETADPAKAANATITLGWAP